MFFQPYDLSTTRQTDNMVYGTIYHNIVQWRWPYIPFIFKVLMFLQYNSNGCVNIFPLRLFVYWFLTIYLIKVRWFDLWKSLLQHCNFPLGKNNTIITILYLLSTVSQFTDAATTIGGVLKRLCQESLIRADVMQTQLMTDDFIKRGGKKE